MLLHLAAYVAYVATLTLALILAAHGWEAESRADWWAGLAGALAASGVAMAGAG